MLPDIDVRLMAMVKTLEETVMPALGAEAQFAREQVGLVCAHLGVIRAQWKHALGFELGTWDRLCDLAVRLRPALGASELGATIDAALATGVDRRDYDQVSAAVKTLAALIDRVIRADDVVTPMDASLKAALVDYSVGEAWRYRVFFAATGIDGDAAALPGLAAVSR